MDHLVRLVSALLDFFNQKLTQGSQLLLSQDNSESAHAVAGTFAHIY